MINMFNFIFVQFANLSASYIKNKYKMKIKSIFIIAAFNFIKKKIGDLIYKFIKIEFIKRVKFECVRNSNECI